MTGAVADYNPGTVFKEGTYKTDVKPAEPIPDTALPELPEEPEETQQENSSSGNDTVSEGDSSLAEDTSSADDTSAEETSSADDTSSSAEISSEREASSDTEKLPVETEHKQSAAPADSAPDEEQTVVLNCDPNYSTWADRVSKTGMVKKYELAQIEKDDIKAYAGSADTITAALQTFAKNYQNAKAREAARGKATDAALGTNKTGEMADKVMEGVANGDLNEENADLYYIGVYDMLALYPYDDTKNLVEYIVEIGSKAYTTREDKYCIYPLAAAMTHGQIEMMQYNGVGMMVTYLFNDENILKEFNKYADEINQEISKYKAGGEKYISVWEGIDKSIYESNIAITNQAILAQAAGTLNDEVKKPYGLQTWLTSVQNKIIAVQENSCIKISRENFTVQGKRPPTGYRPSREFDAVM